MFILIISAALAGQLIPHDDHYSEGEAHVDVADCTDVAWGMTKERVLPGRVRGDGQLRIGPKTPDSL